MIQIISYTVKQLLFLILGAAALFLLFSTPNDNSQSWMTDLLVSKTAGIAIGYLAIRLQKHLERQ